MISALYRTLGLLLLALIAPVASAAAAEGECKHAISLIGAPKMGPDFKHFDWVNPDAPKGGVLKQFAEGSFDTLNPFSDKGVKAGGLGLVFDALTASSPDEPSTEYGLIAECISHPADFSSVTFKLREAARFHDGKPVTPEDVIFSFEQLKKVNPFYAFYYKNVVKAEKTGEREVTFNFDTKENRELPMIVGQMSIVPKHYWEGKNDKGEQRDLSQTTVEPPLGNGAYRIKSIDTGRRIVLERVPDYWAKDLPVMKGQYNFDTLDIVYYRDRTPAFEDFKAGRLDFWVENQAGAWVSQYDFEAVKKGLVKKEAIPVSRVAPMQAFVFNTRRKQFQDPRVREAFNLLFNFEEANKKLFYDMYVRVASYFENSELQAKGLPEGRELEILNEVRSEVPPEVFTTEYKNPFNKDGSDFRKHQQEAMKLLEAAGYKASSEAVDDPTCGMFCKAMRSIGLSSAKTARVMRGTDGTPFEVEFLIEGETFQRIILPYIRDLESVGIKATVRAVDTAQYKQREDKRDFDIIIDNFAQSLSPGNEQRQFWGSEAADKDASRNTIGIKNPAIDKLIDKVIMAKDRVELVASTRALDRVLCWNHYVVPHWHYPFERLAWWDKFGRPEKLPSQTSAMMQIWWYDTEKAKAVEAAQAK